MKKAEQEVIKKAHDWLGRVAATYKKNSIPTSELYYILGLLESLLMFEPTE